MLEIVFKSSLCPPDSNMLMLQLPTVRMVSLLLEWYNSVPFQFNQFESTEKLYGRLRMYNMFLITKVYVLSKVEEG